MSGLVFDVVNAVIACAALALGILQYRKKDGLSISFLSFGTINQTVQDKQRFAQLTFALANTGSTATIVSAMYLLFPHTDGATTMAPALARGRAARMEPLLVTTGNLVQGQVFFPIEIDERTSRDKNNHIALKLHIELVDGKGNYRAREVEGFEIIEGTQGGLATGYPLGKNAVVLPKPATDKATPLGI